MPAIPSILKQLRFEVISLLSALYLTKDGNHLFAGIFIRNQKEYFVICLKDDVIYMDLIPIKLSQVLNNEISLREFIFKSKQHLNIYSSKRSSHGFVLARLWIHLFLKSFILIPNGFYIWNEYLQSKGECILKK